MKKHLLLKKITLTSLVVAALASTQTLRAQAAAPASSPFNQEETSDVLRILAGEDKRVNINVTSDGISGEVHAMKMGVGDVLTIHGKVDEGDSSTVDPNDPNNTTPQFDYVVLTVGRTRNWFTTPVSITNNDSNKTIKITKEQLNDNSFDIHLTGDHTGQQRVTVQACWTVNGEAKQSEKYPIIVTVK